MCGGHPGFGAHPQDRRGAAVGQRGTVHARGAERDGHGAHDQPGLVPHLRHAHAHQEQAIFEAFVFEGKPHRTDIGDVGFVLESGLFYVPNWGRDYAGNPAPIPRIYFSPINRLYADLYPYYRTAPGKFGIGRIGPFTYDVNEQNVLELSSLEWNGSMILTPSNAENYLAQRFGNDWHVPDPDFYQKYPPHSDKLKAKLNLQ